ncbi:MAG: DUF6027 family protein [Acidimicrobiales bacterium]
MSARSYTSVPRATTPAEPEVVQLERWFGPVASDDPNANFKEDVARYGLLDPMTTIRALADSVGLPVGAVARYVLARYATSGSGGLLELGPSMVHRLWEPVAAAEEADDDTARLAAYSQLRQMISWLRAPLVEPGGQSSDGADDDPR